MSLFFALLPSDLHICILQTWIGCDHSDSAGSDGQLLRALSALDIACCSAKHRGLWLELTASLRFKGMLAIKAHTGCYLQWLGSRRVAVRVLALEELRVGGRKVEGASSASSSLAAGPGSVLALPSVTELVLTTGNMLGHVLACCPNLTSIRSTAGMPFWKILAAQPPMRLTTLAGLVSHCTHVESALLAHGQHLLQLELELKGWINIWDADDPLATMLPQACPLLQSFSIRSRFISLPALLPALTACIHLTELVLEANELVGVSTATDLITAAESALKALCYLKRLVITVNELDEQEVLQQDMAQVLEAHPDLDYLQLQDCSLCRPTG